MALDPSTRMKSVSGDDKGMMDERKKLIDLMLAAKSGDKRVLRRTVRRLASSSDATTSSEATVLSSYADGAGRTPLHFAANFGALGCASYIVDAAPDSITWTDNEGSTALHMAALGGHVDVVKFLLYTGALSNAARQSGDTPLHLAALHSHVAVVAALLENGANVDATGAEGTPLWLAAREGNVEIVAALVAAGATVDAFNAARVTPLIAAAISNQAEVVEKLIEANADVSFVGPAGITALHMAAEHGNVRMIKALLAAPGGEAAAVLKEEHGLKPVELAAGNDHREAVDVLYPVSAIEGETVESLLARHIELRRQENEAQAASKPVPAVAAKPASEADQKRAAELKSEGNRAFVAKDYDAAMKLYSEGLALDPNNHALWSNRSACHKNLGDLDAALRDAEQCIKVKPDWSKGYFRAGCALEAQKRFEDASLSYWEAAKRDTGVKEYRASFQRALALAKEEYNAKKAAAEAGDAAGAGAAVDSAAGAGAGAGAAGATTAAAPAEDSTASADKSKPAADS